MKRHQKGFTLIEMMVVISISAIIVINLLTSVLRTRINLVEIARVVVSDIRIAQANALSSKQYVNGSGAATHRCGYGIHQLSSGDLSVAKANGTVPPNTPENTAYYVYVGRVYSSGNCPNDYKFGLAQDTPILLSKVLDSRVEFYDSSTAAPNFYDTLFEPPDGKLWIDNVHTLNVNNPRYKSQILIRKIGASCPSSGCIYICVYQSGKIETLTTACPDS